MDYLKIVDDNLENWLAKDEHQNCFPNFGSTDYPGDYKRMASYMNEHVHPEVTKGAIANQIKFSESIPFDDIIFLNDHGPKHVSTVIERATELLQKSNAKLTPYEAYILLVAIHFHDVGIYLGREKHEKKINTLMRNAEIINYLPNDDMVLKVIKKIAQAHGGHIDGDKDTIKRVKKYDKVSKQPIRKQFLAAILRFADELADDRSRATRFTITDPQTTPKYSQLFHEYSNSLHTVDIENKEIDLRFYIPVDKAFKKFCKKVNGEDSECYLLEEIYRRTIKMHKEKIYCNRFLVTGGIFIEKIRVCIEILDNQTLDSIEIPYFLQDSGYPDDNFDIFSLCPNLKGKDGQWLVKKLEEKRNKEKENE